MTTLVHSLLRHSPVRRPDLHGINKRATAIVAIAVIISMVPGGWSIALTALSEAYLSVSVFVAGTLALVFASERAFKTDLSSWLERHHRWQVPAATLLGAFPGCGGAIIAVTQYTRGYLSFGGVVATLTATMGDAMFLLLAREPHTALAVLVSSMIIGMITGYVIDTLHGSNFLRPAAKAIPRAATMTANHRPRPLRGVDRIWVGLMAPGVVIGLLAAFQIDLDSLFEQLIAFTPAHWLGVIGAVFVVAMWAIDRAKPAETECEDGVACSLGQTSGMRSVIDNTNFVTTWVVFAFVGYEILIAITGIDMGRVFSVWGPLVPAMAILVGFVPGCGPQIVVTSLYLSGSVPLSAQLGNAIANDGDALFPALAVAPKAALIATVYSAIPALVVAYSWYWVVERSV